ncbi:MAG: hypothetical protein MJZ26_08580 [Fibrobacter sp.]|nr:hypothetical protein [Fibrobacter sp.]
MGYKFGFSKALCVGAFGLLNFAGSVVAAPLAFPEALGFGANVTGGRGGTVYHVTNLNDSGEGSFRDAVSAPNRIVVFDVGGYVTLKSAVTIKSNITIAGQTAPGEGIGFRGGKLSTGKQKNIIIRYIRVRPGSITASTKDDALNLYDSKDIIVDHSSIEFAPWNNFGGSSDNADYRVTGITVQNSLIANPIYQQFGAHIESIDGTWAWYNNAFINTHNRNPLDKINDIFVNNVHYNFEAGFTTHTSAKFKHDIVNNYFVYGPKGKNEWFQMDPNQIIYASGNMVDSNRDGILNGGASKIYWYNGQGTLLNEPWNELTSKGPMLSAASAWRYVNSQSGVLPYDDIDSLIWYQASTLGKVGGHDASGSLYTTEAQTGLADNGWGIIKGGEKPADSDNDGVPDFFEESMGYNSGKDDAMTIGEDGYAYIEKYINWLGAMHTKVPQNGSGDFDLRTITRGFAAVAPTYSVEAVDGGTVALQGNGYVVRFTPNANYTGLAAFKYTVKGNDGTQYTGRVEVLVEKSDLVVGPSLFPQSGSLNQEIFKGDAIKDIVLKFANCGGAEATELPDGIKATVDKTAKTITLSGTPSKTGVQKISVKTIDDDGETVVVDGSINVRFNAEPVAGAAVLSDVNAAYPNDGIGNYEENNAGWRNEGYYNFNNTMDSYGVWNLMAETGKAGALVTIRFANGGKSARPMELFVNDVSYGIIDFPATGAWTTWDSVSVKADLVKNGNILKLVSQSADGGPNVDQIGFDVAGVKQVEGEVVVEKDDQTDSCEEGKEDECDSEEKDPTAISYGSTVPLTHAAVASFDFERGAIFASRDGYAVVSVFNASGRLVAKFAGDVKAGVNRLDIKKANLPRGHYETKVTFR